MVNINKKAVILIYIVFLVNIAVVMAMVIVNNSYIFFNDVQSQNIIEKSNKNIYDKANSTFNLARFYNTNGSGFIDNMSCPDNVTSPLKPITLSGSINRTTTGSTFIDYSNGNIYCSGSYLGSDLKILFSKDYTSFTGATYAGSYTNLLSGSGLTAFSDGQNTSILFTSTGLNSRDKIDDNFNSDNYRANSTGTTATGTYYPNGFYDDDIIHRKKFFGYIEPSTINNNIFFNNKETNEVISGSLNNGDSLNLKIGSNNGYMMLDIDGTYDLKIVKFSKIKYNEFRLKTPKEGVPIELSPIETFKGLNITSGFGYIYKKSDGSLTTYPYNTADVTTGGAPYLFDFINYYYGIFVTNNTSGVLTYNLSAETSSGTGMYIVPIDDNSVTDLRFLGNDITDDLGKYTGYQFSVFGKK